MNLYIKIKMNRMYFDDKIYLSPVLAAKIVHRIPGYDDNIGKFMYGRNEIYVITPEGYYNPSISSNAEICTKGSGNVGGAVSTKIVEKV